MDCNEARDDFSALIDGELSADARARIEVHLSECADCLRALDKLKRVDGLYRSLAPQAAPEDFDERVRAAIAVPHEVKPRAVRNAWRWWPAWVAVAACIAILVSVGVLRTGARSDRFNVASVETRQESASPKGIVQESARPLTANQPVPQADGAPTPMAEVGELANADKETEPVKAGDAGGGVARDAVALGGAEVPPPPSPSPSMEDAPQSRPVQMKKLEPKSDAKPKTSTAPLASRAPAPAPQPRAVSAPASVPAPPESVSLPVQGEMKAERALPSAAPPVAMSREVEGSQPAQSELRPVPLTSGAMALDSQAAPNGTGAAREMRVKTKKGMRAAESRTIESSAMAKAEPLPGSMAAAAPAVAERKDADTLERKTVTGRAFTLRDGVWQQDGYAKDTRAKTLRRDTKTFEVFLKKHPDVKPILDLGDRVVFQCEDQWYRVEPKGA